MNECNNQQGEEYSLLALMQLMIFFQTSTLSKITFYISNRSSLVVLDKLKLT